ncbi:hypothetical protein [Leptospira sp. GIMC2001]|uniref:hypothetical protein n=1 Tax=Leptospira sp. GIMC2001 TaxID=1513297 RepID=UPI00234950A9|nr:hypothetical protein [Leptospira sp. GIMC2001]WCL48147.1 hypothetical protein O4O04_12590 [Leptospira sp. GIMC2001]
MSLIAENLLGNIELEDVYIQTCEILSKNTSHIPGFYQTGDLWDNRDWDFFAKALTLELGKLEAYQGFLWGGSYLYEFGFRLLSPAKIEEKIINNKDKIFREYLPKKPVATGSFTKDQIEFITSTSVHSAQRAGFILILVHRKDRPVLESKWNPIVQLLENLGYAVGGGEHRYFPLFREFSDQFFARIRNQIELAGKAGVITHFYIQDLTKYFDALGLQKSFELLKEIQARIQAHLKKDDIFLHQGTRSFFTFSPGCNADIVLKRFEEVFLQIEHLIIDYRLIFREVGEDDDPKDIWQDLLVEI